MCDYCPSEFQSDDGFIDLDDFDVGYKRHGRHKHLHYKNQPAYHPPISSLHQHDKPQRTETMADRQSKAERSRHSGPEERRHSHPHHKRKYKDDRVSLQSKEYFLDGINNESENFGEYKYENLNAEDNGKIRVLRFICFKVVIKSSNLLSMHGHLNDLYWHRSMLGETLTLLVMLLCVVELY